MRSLWNAQQQIGVARRLRREGRRMDAFRIVVEAFALLRSADLEVAKPAASTIMAFDTVLLDELARSVGHSDAAREELAEALRFCEEATSASPRLQPQLQQYIDWYRYRLSELGPGAVH